MSGPDAKRRSVAYVLVFCPTAEVLLEKKIENNFKKTVRNTIYFSSFISVTQCIHFWIAVTSSRFYFQCSLSEQILAFSEFELAALYYEPGNWWCQQSNSRIRGTKLSLVFRFWTVIRIYLRVVWHPETDLIHNTLYFLFCCIILFNCIILLQPTQVQ